jgi:hypothetical protein
MDEDFGIARALCCYNGSKGGSRLMMGIPLGDIMAMSGPQLADAARLIAPEHDVAFGSEADICAAKRNVRFIPDSDRESGFPQKAMSALPPRADMGAATTDVGYGPIADI